MTQSEFLLQVYTIMDIKKAWPEISYADKVKNLLYVHGKGYLHGSLDSDGDVDMFAVMYRIPEYSREIVRKFPEKEEGDILYIPIWVSVAKDIYKGKRILNKYLKQHPEVKRIMFRERENNGKIKSFNKEKHHGKRLTENTDTGSSVSGRSPVCAGT